MTLGREIKFYILDENNRPVVADHVMAARYWSKRDHHVAYTMLANDRVCVSTIFLFTDHRHVGKGPPLLFETMVFGLKPNEADESYQWRYSTWDDAEIGHHATVRKVQKLLDVNAQAGAATKG